MIKASIIGGTGYMGFELLRLLVRHPKVELGDVTSRSDAGTKISDAHPALKGFLDEDFVAELSKPADNDVVFVAAPHGASMDIVPPLIKKGCRVIDLSGDYRLGNSRDYEKWYGKKHTDRANLVRAVYGLTELNRSKIAKAQLVANPGCYPTGALLALIPAAKANIIGGDVIVDSKSGTSGAGATPGDLTHHPSCAPNVLPYNVGKHRHTPEIEGTLKSIGANFGEVSFTPHLVPLVRGIQTSCYVRLSKGVKFGDVLKAYQSFSKKNHFVKLVDGTPKITSVLGSNFCHVSVAMASKNLLAAFSAIDNLCKGGSGQAVQNMNVMLGLGEETGLDIPGLGV
jgi:N-acetyl-gamma-glutamyl-phosphate reductase